MPQQKCQRCNASLDAEKGEVFLTDEGGVYCNDCYTYAQECPSCHRLVMNVVWLKGDPFGLVNDEPDPDETHPYCPECAAQAATLTKKGE